MNKRTEHQQDARRRVSAHITLPPDLKREAQIRALREGRTLSDIIEELLAEYVKK